MYQTSRITSNSTRCNYTEVPTELEKDLVPVQYTCQDGSKYIYYSSICSNMVKNFQFCNLIGKKRDVFQCLNQSEWEKCPYYLLETEISNKGS